MVNYLLGDTVTRINNASKLKKNYVIVLKSNLVLNFLNILYKEGYIKGFYFFKNHKLIVLLKYYENRPVFEKLDLISKPSKRIYLNYKNILLKYSLTNLVIYSSSIGLLTNKNLFFNLIKTYNQLKNNYFYNYNIYKNSLIEFFYWNSSFEVNYNFYNLNNFNSLSRIYFYNTTNYIKYNQKFNLFMPYTKLNFKYYYNLTINYNLNFLNYSKNLNQFLSFLILKKKKKLNIKKIKFFYKKLVLLIFINRLLNIKKKLNIKKLNNLNLNLNKKKIKFNNKLLLNNNNSINKLKGGEVLVLVK